MASEQETRCPWCGAPAIHGNASKTRFDWGCGSCKHGVEPTQAPECRVNELEAEVGRLRGLIRRVWETVPATYDENHPSVRAHAAVLVECGAEARHREAFGYGLTRAKGGD